MPEVSVNLGDRSYVVTVGQGALAQVGRIVASASRPSAAVVVSNRVIAGHYGAQAVASLSEQGIKAGLAIVPAGERFKTLKTVQRIYDSMLDMRVDRRGAVVALGGGVVGDMAGFAAATYMRGIDFYQAPTTLLAQVDASVGGKTGVDLPRGKNLVGAFYQPRAVVIDTLTLQTLPARELRSGLAEVIKHGIIYDQGFYHFVDEHARGLLARQEDALERAIVRSVEIKRDVVESDERESGIRAILNYGHTVGHAIEVLSGYGKYRHGEASSIGMVTEAFLAEAEGYAPAGIARTVAGTLRRLGLPVAMDESLSAGQIVEAAQLDKKAINGQLRLALPTAIGRCEVFSVSAEALGRAVDAHRGSV